MSANETVEDLLRILRRYADSSLGAPLAAELAALADSGVSGLTAHEPDSDERVVESVLAAIHQQLALLVVDLRLEIGYARIEAARLFKDVDPSDFGG